MLTETASGFFAGARSRISLKPFFIPPELPSGYSADPLDIFPEVHLRCFLDVSGMEILQECLIAYTLYIFSRSFL